jgi:flagellar P-ring protein precursor FlgI
MAHKLLPSLLLAVSLVSAAAAQVRLVDISRIKGQEDNELIGTGLVVGLPGTGDGGNVLPSIRALANMLDRMGHPLPAGLAELKQCKNIALVEVRATVPASGSREGNRIDCVISSTISAKSLAGGELLPTPLVDARRGSDVVYAVAQGPVRCKGVAARTGRVMQGCRLERDIYTPFVKDGKLTVILDRDMADFRLAQEVEYRINEQFSLDSQYGGRVPAKARDQVNIEVFVPPQYAQHPADFVAQINNLPIDNVPAVARVYIDQQSGLVVVGGEVEIGAVAITHKDILVEVGGEPREQFVSVDPAGNNNNARLKALVESLNAIKVPAEDIIEIVRGLQRNRKLMGKVVIE